MISNYETQYQSLLRKVLLIGKTHQARNATTMRLFNQQLTADLRQGFPMLTGRRLPWDGIKGELLAFINGYVLLEDFNVLSCNFWDKQALTTPDGIKHIGPAYGYQWRNFSAMRPTGVDTADGVMCDQLAELILSLATDPGSRRHVITAWQPNDLEFMALPPCHMMAQWHVESSTADFSRSVEQSPRAAEHGTTALSVGPGNAPILHCTVTMRSTDMFVGAPADMACYALLTHLLALALEYEPGIVCINMADCHIYEANIEQVNTYLESPCYDLPEVRLSSEVLDRLTNAVHLHSHLPGVFTNAAIKWLESLNPADVYLDGYQTSGPQTVTMVA